MEAAIGIEPMYKGFADPRLTTWLRRRERKLCPGQQDMGLRGGLNLAVGLEIDLTANPQDVDAIGMVTGGILGERLGGFAGRRQTGAVDIIAPGRGGGNRLGGGGTFEHCEVVNIAVMQLIQRLGVLLVMIIPVRGNRVENLLQVVLALGAPGFLPQLHRPRRQEADENADDGNDNQQLDEGKPRSMLLGIERGKTVALRRLSWLSAHCPG